MFGPRARMRPEIGPPCNPVSPCHPAHLFICLFLLSRQLCGCLLVFWGFTDFAVSVERPVCRGTETREENLETPSGQPNYLALHRSGLSLLFYVLCAVQFVCSRPSGQGWNRDLFEFGYDGKNSTKHKEDVMPKTTSPALQD